MSKDRVQSKYPKPKILLIDVEEAVADELRVRGHNVAVGSLGQVHEVKPSNNLYAVEFTGLRPPHYSESDIIVVDLTVRQSIASPPAVDTVIGEDYIWVKGSAGIIDTRVRGAAALRNDFDRILSAGGVLIVFAQPSRDFGMFMGELGRRAVEPKGKVAWNTWSFSKLFPFDAFSANSDAGVEMETTESVKDWALADLLRRCVGSGSFTCAFSHKFRSDTRVTLMTNRFGASVAFAELDKSALAIVVPQLEHKSDFLRGCLEEVLPSVMPEKFPHIEKGRWVFRDEYEMPENVNRKLQIAAVREEAQARIQDIENEITAERNRCDHLFGILQLTGDDLVAAVKTTLESIGFTDVMDVDATVVASGELKEKREDLRIDGSPLVVVEVKGIGGLPTEANALQVWKYISPRMKQLQRTDIRGLAIINHQRNLPALDRDNRNVFQEDVLTTAEEQDVTLMTTWDLFRLARSYDRLNWTHELVRPLFYRNGRVGPIPVHYEFVGTIANVFTQVGVIDLHVTGMPVSVGDTIAIEFPVEFAEQVVSSMEQHNSRVESAAPESNVGVKMDFDIAALKAGFRVFRVRQDH